MVHKIKKKMSAADSYGDAAPGPDDLLLIQQKLTSFNFPVISARKPTLTEVFSF